MRQQFLVVLSLPKATRGPCCTRGPRVGGSSRQGLGEVMSDKALTVVRQSNKGQKEENREAKQQECVVLPLTRRKKKHILHNDLISGKMQVCKYTYIFMYIYICLCKCQSPHEFPFCSWLQEKSLIIQMKRLQEKDYRIWGTVKYHFETKFKFEYVHFSNKDVVLKKIIKSNFWGSIFFLQSNTGSFHNRIHYDF